MASVVQIPTTKNPQASDIGNFSARRGRPFLFQVVDPLNRPIYPVLLAMHVNPTSLSESMTKSKTVVMTYGGFVEWVWPDELDSLSADATTGAFISPDAGLTAGSIGRDNGRNPGGRQATIAWERQQDLIELFHQNGAIYNGAGQPVLRGRIMCIYDRGIFVGHFTTFRVTEDDQHAYSFALNWEFKVEQTIYKFPSGISLPQDPIAPGVGPAQQAQTAGGNSSNGI